MRDGRERSNQCGPGEQRDSLNAKLNEAEKRWSDVRRANDLKCRDIDALHSHSKKYSDEAVTFSIWLEKVEKKKNELEDQPIYCNESDLKAQRKETEVHNFSLFYLACIMPF